MHLQQLQVSTYLTIVRLDKERSLEIHVTQILLSYDSSFIQSEQNCGYYQNQHLIYDFQINY